MKMAETMHVPSGGTFKKTCLTTFASFATKASKDHMPGHIELRGGVFSGELLRLELPGLCIDYGIYNLRASANERSAENCYTVGLLLDSDAGSSVFEKEVVVGDVVYLPPRVELVVIVGGQASWSTLTFNKEQFERFYNKRFAGQAPAREIDKGAVIEKDFTTVKLLRFVRSVLLSDQQQILTSELRYINRSLTDYLLEMCVDAIFTDQQLSVDHRTATHTRIVEDAENYLNSQDMDPIKVMDLAIILNVCIRKLQYAFRDILGITPKRYLKIRRLNFVRQQLLREPGKTISHHAAQAGFWHMAQFTKDYKEMFGETPSETLSKWKTKEKQKCQA